MRPARLTDGQIGLPVRCALQTAAEANFDQKKIMTIFWP
jgi:hypothetical protein